jgi:hypothetical protein
MFSVGSARLSASSLAGNRCERASCDTIIMSFGLRSAARAYSPVGLARGENQMSHATRLLRVAELLVTVLGLAACSGGGGGGDMGQMQLAVADAPVDGAQSVVVPCMACRCRAAPKPDSSSYPASQFQPAEWWITPSTSTCARPSPARRDAPRYRHGAGDHDEVHADHDHGRGHDKDDGHDEEHGHQEH